MIPAEKLNYTAKNQLCQPHTTINASLHFKIWYKYNRSISISLRI